MASVRTRSAATSQLASGEGAGGAPPPRFAPALRRKVRRQACAEDSVVPVDGFLSEQECRAILDELKFAFWQPSLTYVQRADGRHFNAKSDARVSSTAHVDWFTDELIQIVKRIEQRLQNLFGVDPAKLEPWQATEYCRNEKFDFHLDSGYWGDHPAGDRTLTFLFYLTTPRKGGATHFRALDKSFDAKAGRLLVWNNLFANGNPNAKMIHSAMPVLGGRKVTLVTWQRQRKWSVK
jgi:prolyl 4-hydroxylase